jgi:hypothetical protein
MLNAFLSGAVFPRILGDVLGLRLLATSRYWLLVLSLLFDCGLAGEKMFVLCKAGLDVTGARL